MGNCNNFCRAYDPENVSNISKLQEIEDALSKEIIKENEKEVKSSKIYAKTSKNFYTMKEGSENKLYDEKKNSTLISFHADSDEDHKSTSSQYSQRQNKKFIPKATRTSNKHKEYTQDKMLSFPASESKKESLALIQECSVENLSSIKKKNKKETNLTEKKINKDVVQILEVSKGVIYEGELNDGKRHGKGKQKWKEGTIYEGDWKEDQANGKGIIVHREGDFYEGEWKQDKANGFGIYKSSNGADYEGEWMDDLQHGVGKEKWPDGSLYEGSFKLGKKNGRGKINFADGSHYEGEFVDNNIEGEGIYVWTDGKIYVGQWYQNKMHGNGEFTWEDGKKYIGEYQNDRKHGLGKMIFKNNKKAYGFWKSDLQHGKGILLDDLGIIEKKAEWKDGLKINEFKSDETKGFEVILNLIELDNNKN